MDVTLSKALILNLILSHSWVFWICYGVEWFSFPEFVNTFSTKAKREGQKWLHKRRGEGLHIKEERLLQRLHRKKKNRSTFTRLCNTGIWSYCATHSAARAERESIGTRCHYRLPRRNDKVFLEIHFKKKWCDNCRLDDEGRRPIVLAAELGLHMFVKELLKVKCHYINEQVEVGFLPLS